MQYYMHAYGGVLEYHFRMCYNSQIVFRVFVLILQEATAFAVTAAP